MFKGVPGLTTHLRKSNCRPVKDKVWMENSTEECSPWVKYCDKEIFFNALGLRLIGDLTHEGNEVMYDEGVATNEWQMNEESLRENNHIEEPGEGIEESGMNNAEIRLADSVVTDTNNDSIDVSITSRKPDTNTILNDQDVEVLEGEDDYELSEIEIEVSVDLETDIERRIEERVHEMIETDKSNRECPICKKMFKNRRLRRNHEINIHKGPYECPLCKKVLSSKKHLDRHRYEIHHNHENKVVCSICGDTFLRKEWLKYHETRCSEGKLGKQKEPGRKFNCQYCVKHFSSNYQAKKHEKETHFVEMKGGYMLVPELTNKTQQEYICYVFPKPVEFSSNFNLKKHSMIKHNGKNDEINYRGSVRKLSMEEIRNQYLKKLECNICNEEFSSMQNLKRHKNDIHHDEQAFNCIICKKVFKTKKLMMSHKSAVCRNLSFNCPVCGKKSKRKSDCIKHEKTHETKLATGKKPLVMLKERQVRNRTNIEVKEIKTLLLNAPENAQKHMVNSIVKDFPYFTNKIKDNPISEAEAIEIIKDNDLSDKQVLNLFKFLRNKWGKEIITRNIAKKLVKRKTILDQYFSQINLDKSSDLFFKSKKGTAIKRSVTYCHDLPGLIAFKKLVENIDETDMEVLFTIFI